MLDDPASYIPPANSLLQEAAIAACDAIDGVKDGLIENPRLCHFDPAVIQCKGDDGPDCLTAPQVEAARKIYGPVKNPEPAPRFPRLLARHRGRAGELGSLDHRRRAGQLQSAHSSQIRFSPTWCSRIRNGISTL